MLNHSERKEKPLYSPFFLFAYEHLSSTIKIRVFPLFQCSMNFSVQEAVANKFEVYLIKVA